MQRLESDGDWSLFDPADVIGLTGLVGDAFVAAYETYEHSGIATAFMPARVLWDVITGAQRESGSPFIMFSDNINSTPLPRFHPLCSVASNVLQVRTTRCTWE